MGKLGFFSEQLADSMARQSLTAKTLALKLGCSYENIRRKLDGHSLPSPRLLRRLCAIFGWNEKKLCGFVMMDQARNTFKGSFWLALGRNPKCEPVYILWQFLSEEERDYFVACLRILATRKQQAEEVCTDSIVA